MLKGHVFKKQVFGNQIFALFVNTFLDGQNGVSDNYKNNMAITHNTSSISVDTGMVCVQGRFLEEDSGYTVATGTDNSFCKLVIEIDLDKENTDEQFVQGAYKIIKSTSSYPELTQNNIVKNNSGIYQYELARFRTSSSGITEFQDSRTFLNLSIFETIVNKILENKFKKVSLYASNRKEDDFNGYVEINYPDGFNKSNTALLSMFASTSLIGGDTYNATSEIITFSDNKIIWSDVFEGKSVRRLELLLMKI